MALACARTPSGGDAKLGAERGDASAESVDPRPTTSVGRLDAALAEHWAAAEVEPNALASDAEYLRRVSLDLIGRVPTQAEVVAFLDDERVDKRAALVDRLLDSPEFAEHWARLWAAQLVPSERKARRVAEGPMRAYFDDVLRENRSWDVVVDELLTGEGAVDDDPARAFIAARNLRGANKQSSVAELTSTTTRVFLGARIECAQCHDHPYVDFSREDFWATAAFFGRTFTEQVSQSRPPEVSVGERGRGELRVALGDDDDPRKRAIAPRFMGSEAVEHTDERRAALAAAIVDDPRFAEATVGQTWTRLLGRGVVDPWDDLLVLSADDRPPVLTVLADEFRDSGYDMRHLLRTIVLSQAYQRSSASADGDRDGLGLARERAFAQAAVRPLSAEQLFGSLITATGLEQVEDRAFRRAVQTRKQAALKEYTFVFSDDEMANADAFSGAVPEALLLLNGALTNQGVVARPGSSLDRILGDHDDVDARLIALWLTVYGRVPSDAELELGRATVGDGRRDADWEDLMFAMLNSTEFTSNH